MSIPPDKSTGLRLSPSPGEESRYFSCSYPNCGYIDERMASVASHERHHNPSFQQPFPCQVCPKMFGALVSFLHHMSSRHRYKLLCPFCKFQAQDWTEFKPHIVTHSSTLNSGSRIRTKSVGQRAGTVLRCAICSQMFPSREALSQHLKECSRKLNSVPESTEKSKTRKSQESFERPKQTRLQTEESPCFQTEEISNSSNSSSSSSTMEVEGSIAETNTVRITIHRCAICSIMFTSRESFVQHLKECCLKLKAKRIPVSLDRIQESFENFKRTEESDLSETEETSNSASSSSSIIMQGPDRTEFQSHILTHSSTLNSVPKGRTKRSKKVATVPRCAICSIIFTSRESLVQHLKECSRKLNPKDTAKRIKANSSGTSQGSFEHFKRTEESVPYTTEETSNSPSGSSSIIMEAADWTEFKPHILTHSSTLNSIPKGRTKNRRKKFATVLRCAICSIIFNSKESLSQHLKICCRKLRPLPSSSSESFENPKQMDESSRSHDHTEYSSPSNPFATWTNIKTEENLG